MRLAFDKLDKGRIDLVSEELRNRIAQIMTQYKNDDTVKRYCLKVVCLRKILMYCFPWVFLATLIYRSKQYKESSRTFNRG